MTKTWDGESFRRHMRTAAINAQNYADEHSARLRRGQANGRASMRDESSGESVICDVLSTSAATDSPSALLAYLDRQEEFIQSEHAVSDVEDKDAYRRGYLGRIRRIRAELKTDPGDGS